MTIRVGSGPGRAGRARRRAFASALALAAAGATVGSPGTASAEVGCIGNPSAYIASYHYTMTYEDGFLSTGNLILRTTNESIEINGSTGGVAYGRWAMSTVTKQPVVYDENPRGKWYQYFTNTTCVNGRAEAVEGYGSATFLDGSTERSTFTLKRIGDAT